VCVEHFLLHADLVAHLRDAGLSVTTGTINDPELARRVAALDVDAITTDDPARLRAAAGPDQASARRTAMILG
jgi:glycerophosphoryl diester phosphodiesterase